jgi:hypothetical protein
MGELAFTRDTGRLFVGNYTNATKPLDSSYVKGGILSGNKYLGMIDSKPLIHFSASGSTGWKPLSYFENTTDPIVGTEYALFGENSKYRKDDVNGWNKEATYIDKYGVYSGDYVYDIYENALIIFDKNITTNASEQPLRKIVKSSNGKSMVHCKWLNGKFIRALAANYHHNSRSGNHAEGRSHKHVSNPHQ